MYGPQILARLNRERKSWLNTIPVGQEVQWTVRGIDKCIGVTKDLIREGRNRELARKPYVSRWLSRDLYHAMDMALRKLSRGDSKLAIGILEKAMIKAMKASKKR